MKRIKSVFLCTGVITSCIFLSEIGLRIAGIGYPFFYDLDPQIGGVLYPNVSGVYTDEGYAFVRINSGGMRDYEHPVLKPPGQFRIALLGDSYCEALQVDITNTFWHTAQNKLNVFSGGNPEIRILNFGISGHGTAQQYLMLTNKVVKYNPDAVLLTVTTGNDIRNNSYELEAERLRPFFRMLNEELLLDVSFSKTPGYYIRKIYYPLVRNLVVFQIIHRALYTYRYPVLTPSKKLHDETKLIPIVLTNFFHENPLHVKGFNPELEKAWDITARIIFLVHEFCRKRKIQLVIITLSNSYQVKPEGINTPDAYLPDLRIRDIAQSNAIPVLNLAPLLKQYAEHSGEMLHGFGQGVGHWNEIGHKISGEIIASWLITNFNFLHNQFYDCDK